MITAAALSQFCVLSIECKQASNSSDKHLYIQGPAAWSDYMYMLLSAILWIFKMWRFCLQLMRFSLNMSFLISTLKSNFVTPDYNNMYDNAYV